MSHVLEKFLQATNYLSAAHIYLRDAFLFQGRTNASPHVYGRGDEPREITNWVWEPR